MNVHVHMLMNRCQIVCVHDMTGAIKYTTHIKSYTFHVLHFALVCAVYLRAKEVSYNTLH